MPVHAGVPDDEGGLNGWVADMDCGGRGGRLARGRGHANRPRTSFGDLVLGIVGAVVAGWMTDLSVGDDGLIWTILVAAVRRRRSVKGLRRPGFTCPMRTSPESQTRLPGPGRGCGNVCGVPTVTLHPTAGSLDRPLATPRPSTYGGRGQRPARWARATGVNHSTPAARGRPRPRAPRSRSARRAPSTDSCARSLRTESGPGHQR